MLTHGRRRFRGDRARRAGRSGLPVDRRRHRAANAGFGVTPALLDEAHQAALARNAARSTTTSCTSETGQGLGAVGGAHHGVDQQTCSARAYGRRRFGLLVNTVVGFIGPEYLLRRQADPPRRAGGSLLRANCSACRWHAMSATTNHAEADQDDMDAADAARHRRRHLRDGHPGADDIMLNTRPPRFTTRWRCARRSTPAPGAGVRGLAVRKRRVQRRRPPAEALPAVSPPRRWRGSAEPRRRPASRMASGRDRIAGGAQRAAAIAARYASSASRSAAGSTLSAKPGMPAPARCAAPPARAGNGAANRAEIFDRTIGRFRSEPIVASPAPFRRWQAGSAARTPQTRCTRHCPHRRADSAPASVRLGPRDPAQHGELERPLLGVMPPACGSCQTR